MEGQIKCFPDKVTLKEFIITKPLLYEILKGLIKEKEDKKYEQEDRGKMAARYMGAESTSPQHQ